MSSHLATALWKARIEGGLITVDAGQRPANTVDAYAIQDEVAALFDSEIVGWRRFLSCQPPAAGRTRAAAGRPFYDGHLRWRASAQIRSPGFGGLRRTRQGTSETGVSGAHWNPLLGSPRLVPEEDYSRRWEGSGESSSSGPVR